jgi:hypothetical protein
MVTSYSVTENDPSPFQLQSINCSCVFVEGQGQCDASEVKSGSTVTVAVDFDEAFTCTFTNAFPTASSLASFESQLLSPEVTQISWMTALENGVKAFNLYSATNMAEFSSAVFIQSFLPHGNFIPYTHLDGGVQAGAVKYYWLEMEYLDGSIKLYGPTPAGYMFDIYLPVHMKGLPSEYPY